MADHSLHFIDISPITGTSFLKGENVFELRVKISTFKQERVKGVKLWEYVVLS